jgi:hypothetical protein
VPPVIKRQRNIATNPAKGDLSGCDIEVNDSCDLLDEPGRVDKSINKVL